MLAGLINNCQWEKGINILKTFQSVKELGLNVLKLFFSLKIEFIICILFVLVIYFKMPTIVELSIKGKTTSDPDTYIHRLKIDRRQREYTSTQIVNLHDIHKPSMLLIGNIFTLND